jgi:hypothetical protein
VIRVTKGTVSLARQKFKERARKEVSQRHQRSIRIAAAKLQAKSHTLKGWLIETVEKGKLPEGGGRKGHRTIGRFSSA